MTTQCDKKVRTSIILVSGVAQDEYSKKPCFANCTFNPTSIIVTANTCVVHSSPSALCIFTTLLYHCLGNFHSFITCLWISWYLSWAWWTFSVLSDMDDLNCTLNPMKQRCLQWLLCFLLVIPYNNLFICLYLFACFRFISFFWHFQRTVLPFHAVTLNFQCYRRFKVMCFIFLTTLFWAALWNHMICSYSSIHIPRWHICGSREYQLFRFLVVVDIRDVAMCKVPQIL
jgi:hypothetical protein